MTVQSVLSDKSVAVVCGSGGVGKTTTAASIALMAAATSDRKVLVLTIDPARRLADVLGIATAGNEVVKVDIPGEAQGRLFAQMLDTKNAWDELVRRHAPDADTVKRILTNPLYGEITERFVQSHDYIAMETLHELHDSGEFDLIVIDTPPVSQAVDFLDAPQRMASFFDSRLLKFLIAPAKASFLNFTSRAFLQIADKLLGRRFLEDITELFTLLETMRPGFIARANDVDRLLRADETSFVVVTTAEPAPSKSAQRFVEELKTRNFNLGAVVLNKVLPTALSDPSAREAARYLVGNADEVSVNFENQASVKRVLTGAAENFDRFEQLAKAEHAFHVELAGGTAARASAPWFSSELDDLSGLRRLGESIWS